MDDNQKLFIGAYFQEWRNHIKTLERFNNSESRTEREIAFTLALCYIEALGKMHIYKLKGKHYRPTIIFQKTLKQYFISKKDSKRIYKVRCELIHTGLGVRRITIKENGNDTTINFEWCINKLTDLLNKVEKQCTQSTLEEICYALDAQVNTKQSKWVHLKEILKLIFKRKS